GRKDLRVSPAFGTAFLTVLCSDRLPDDLGGGVGGLKNPLADMRVRQALAMSIDKKFIVDNVTRMGELPARTYLPPDGTLPMFTFVAGPYDPSRDSGKRYTDSEFRKLLLAKPAAAGPGLPYDPDAARKLLAD